MVSRSNSVTAAITRRKNAEAGVSSEYSPGVPAVMIFTLLARAVCAISSEAVALQARAKELSMKRVSYFLESSSMSFMHCFSGSIPEMTSTTFSTCFTPCN